MVIYPSLLFTQSASVTLRRSVLLNNILNIFETENGPYEITIRGAVPSITSL